MDKRGISAVVATILIVLITIIAVSVLWQVLKPAIQKSAEKVTMSCLDVDLSIGDADCTTTGTEYVTVTLNSGQISKLKVLFYDANGNSLAVDDEAANTKTGEIDETGEVVLGEELPGELETIKYEDLSVPTDAAKVNVGTFVETAAGEEISCGLALTAPKSCAVAA